MAALPSSFYTNRPHSVPNVRVFAQHEHSFRLLLQYVYIIIYTNRPHSVPNVRGFQCLLNMCTVLD